MAEENHDGFTEMFLPLQEDENSSTLPPTAHTNDISDQFSNPKPNVNLQLSLGGCYDKTPNSTPALPTSSPNQGNFVLKRSYFEQNKFMHNKEAEIKITREVQVFKKTKNQEGVSAEKSESEKSKEAKTSVTSLDIPAWAVQSAYENPAFQRALKVIKSASSLHRTHGSTNWKGSISKKPHATEGFGSQHPIQYQTSKNGQSIATHINYGTNQGSFLPQKQPENLNLVPPANFCGATENGIPDQQLQHANFVSPFNCSLATMERLPFWRKDESLNMHPKAAAFAPSSSCAKVSSLFPDPYGTGGTNISIGPPNATGYDQSQVPSNFLSNLQAAPYLFPTLMPTSSSTNATGNSFMPPERNRANVGSGARPIPLSEVINGSRLHDNPINPPENPCKRARHDNGDYREVELELIKQWPTVVTTGGNPNKKKTEGFLYKYGSAEEVIIVCVCHGCFFSPEEFVRHAGGGDVENPMQEISLRGLY